MPFPVYNNRPTVGEMFTVTCFACGHPSSKEWAQKVSCRPYRQEPYFPFLLDEHPAPQGGHVMEDGTVNLCAFCHALLESQWNSHEARRILPPQRKYNVHKFICAVCGVETYRKRVRALPFQVILVLLLGYILIR
jgi:ribosomal protein L37E